MAKKKVSKRGLSDKAFNTILMIFFILFLIIILYPMIFIVSSSFSSGQAVSSGRVYLWPVDLSVVGYELVFKNQAVWVGYRNTIIYTVAGTIVNVIFTVLAAYPLSRRDLPGRNIFLIFFAVPMFFSGGLIPTYLLMTKLGLVNTPWILIIGGALGLGNMVIMRTFFQTSIPLELLESAQMDGISDIGYLMKIVLPLSKASISVITLYYLVGHWNNYFSAMIYLQDRNLYPLQLILRDIMNATKIDTSMMVDAAAIAQLTGATDVMKYALVIISTLPMMILYPFVQKFFEKGVMIGALKG